jgi:hypothetical protein
MWYQKLLYMLAGAILGVAGTAAAYMFVVEEDNGVTVATTTTPTSTPTTTSTARPSRTPTATRTATPTTTATVETNFAVGQTVTLTNGSGNCLQTYAEPTFDSRKLQCQEDLTRRRLIGGPHLVTDSGGTFVWWELEGGSYIIEKWIRR